VFEVAPHPDERAARVERVAENLEQRGAALQRHQHVPVHTEIRLAPRVEQARSAAHVEPLLGWSKSVKAGRNAARNSRSASREAGVLELAT